MVNLASLLRCFVKYDARGDPGVERFHLLRVRNYDEFVHLGHEISGQTGAFITEKNSAGTV